MSTTPEGKEVALLPCPFCGASASGYGIDPHEHALRLGDFQMPDHPGSYVIEGDCACGSGLIGATREEVTERWNRRAATPSALPAAPEGGADVPVEAWKNERKVTIYRDSVLRSWGANIETEMTDEPRSLDSVQSAMDWLYAAPQSPAPEAVPVDVDALRIECGASPEEWADFKRWRHAQRDAGAGQGDGNG